jgi:ketosteroid isomerase-like protein
MPGRSGRLCDARAPLKRPDLADECRRTATVDRFLTGLPSSFRATTVCNTLPGMSRTNAEVVRANSAAFSRRDDSGMLDFYAPDAVVIDRRAVGWGEFRGHDAMRSYYQGLFDNADELHEDLRIVSDEDDLIIASCQLTAQLVGQPDAPPVVFEYALRIAFAEGVIQSLEIYEDAAAAARGARSD